MVPVEPRLVIETRFCPYQGHVLPLNYRDITRSLSDPPIPGSTVKDKPGITWKSLVERRSMP